MEARLILDARATLGEGPVWDHHTQRLYWVDIMEKRIHLCDADGANARFLQLDQYVGAIAQREAGGLIAALQHGFYTVDVDSGELTPLSDPEQELAGNRFNDGKCDPAGRFWAGTMSLTNQPKAGALYRLDTDFSVQRMVEEIGISNGLAWTADAATMYYIDTHTRRVDAFDFDLESGTLRNRRTVIEIDTSEGSPDGMTIDEEGMLWIAHWGGWQVSRWNPVDGKKIGSIAIPASNVTSCSFGGADWNELFVTTARVGVNEERLTEQPYAGGVFKVKLDVKGTPAHRFKG